MKKIDLFGKGEMLINDCSECFYKNHYNCWIDNKLLNPFGIRDDCPLEDVK